MGNEALFLLAAIVRHGGLVLEELPSVTTFRTGLTELLLSRLTDLGAVDNEDGRFRVTTSWYPAVQSTLHRRNILIA